MPRRWRPPVSISPRGYQRITLVAVWLLALIVVTGGAVRLAGSGLGCPHWPTSAKGNVVAPLEGHAAVGAAGGGRWRGAAAVRGARRGQGAPAARPRAVRGGGGAAGRRAARRRGGW